MTSVDSTRTRRELARVLFSRLIGMIVIVVVLLAVVLLTTQLSPRRYRSKVQFMASPAAGLASMEGRATLRERLSLFVATQRELMLSDYVIASALLRLDGVKPKGLAAKDGFKPYTEKQIDTFAAEHAKRISTARRVTRVETPGGADVNFTQTYSMTVEWSEDRAWLQWPSEETGEDAATNANKVADYVKDAYLYRRGVIDSEQTRKIAEFQQSTATVGAKDNLEQAAGELEKFITEDLKGDLLMVEHMLSGIGSEVGSQSLRTTFQGEINKADARLAELAALAAEVDKELGKPAGEQVVVPTVILKANPSMIKLTDAIAKLRMELNNLKPRFTPDYKTLTEVEAELKANLADLRLSLQRQRTILTQDAASLQSRKNVLTTIVAADEKRVSNLASKAATYKRLKQKVAGLQEIYDKRMEEAALAAKAAAQAQVPMEVMVVSKPTYPVASDPHRPLLWLNAMIGLLAGVVLALTYAFVADHMDHSVKSIGDVERYADVPVLTSVPKMGTKIIRKR